MNKLIMTNRNTKNTDKKNKRVNLENDEMEDNNSFVKK